MGLHHFAGSFERNYKGKSEKKKEMTVPPPPPPMGTFNFLYKVVNVYLTFILLFSIFSSVDVEFFFKKWLHGVFLLDVCFYIYAFYFSYK